MSRPGKLIYYRIIHANTENVKDVTTAIAAFATGGLILFTNAPYQSVWDFLLVLVLAFILSGISAIIVSMCIPLIQKILSLLFWIPSWLYDYCDDKINHVERKRGKTIGKGPKARVGIKYFIERERRVQITHAKWLGPE